jgi:hypothetical protein
MKKIIALLSFSFLLFGCEETDILVKTGKLEITDINLPPLPPSYFYEAWLLVDASYVSVGKFNNDSILNNRARFSNIEVNDLADAQSFAITVEKADSPAPSNYVLLVGNFNGNTSQLTVDAELTNGVLPLARRISGSFTVQTATIPDADLGEFGVNGIWFFKGTADAKETTIQLEYEDLRYQAWLRKPADNTFNNLNMGVISSDTLADNWRGFTLPAYQTNTPKFAGEDFLQQPTTGTQFGADYFPLDVRNSEVWITPILTTYADGNEPFPVVLLKGYVPEGIENAPNQTYPLEINTNFGAKATKL